MVFFCFLVFVLFFLGFFFVVVVCLFGDFFEFFLLNFFWGKGGSNITFFANRH